MAIITGLMTHIYNVESCTTTTAPLKCKLYSIIYTSATRSLIVVVNVVIAFRFIFSENRNSR